MPTGAKPEGSERAEHGADRNKQDSGTERFVRKSHDDALPEPPFTKTT
jgi:hypothetical protein